MTAPALHAGVERTLAGRPNHADRAFGYLTIGSAAVVLVILAGVAITMTSRASSAFSQQGLDFFTTSEWSVPDNRYGALAYIWGTIYTSVIALAIAVPVSLSIAIVITQVAPRWLKLPMVYVLDLLAVVPSVVFGLWGLQQVPRIQAAYVWIHARLTGIPLLDRVFGDAPKGASFLTAGIILAIMITPIITSLSREVIETTPQTEKEAAYGLGATRWEMIRGSIIPHSIGGIVGAVMLGLGRAMGETIAAVLLIGSSNYISINAFASGDSMAAMIAHDFGGADEVTKPALIALAVILFVITIAVNIAASAIVRRAQRRSQGGR